jgi:hypothetical protein
MYFSSRFSIGSHMGFFDGCMRAIDESLWDVSSMVTWHSARCRNMRVGCIECGVGGNCSRLARVQR